MPKSGTRRLVFSTRFAPPRDSWAAAELIVVLSTGAILEFGISLSDLAALAVQAVEALNTIHDPSGTLQVVIPDPLPGIADHQT